MVSLDRMPCLRWFCAVAVLTSAFGTKVVTTGGSAGPELLQTTSTAWKHAVELQQQVTRTLQRASPSQLLQKLGVVSAIDGVASKDVKESSSEEDPDTAFRDIVDKERGSSASLWISIAVNLCLLSFVACLYDTFWGESSIDLDKVEAGQGDRDFEHGCFNCLGDLHICFLSFCCLPCRWADTMRGLGFLSYYTAVAIFILLFILRTLAHDFQSSWPELVVWLVSTSIFMYYRQQLRISFSLKNETTDKVKDFFLWGCCCFCAAAQEARQVEQVRQLQQKDAAKEMGA
eukprot:TRINITY_DN48956_c0_g1_i1.p1 TRINITY_DN48956_c0_g1~~TRINITY_DN48956_c0_g1_i1.p1  ORF type:complete len:288 (-),score=65.80 TRINITY_DN48956_c0_g1_i1:45-908(-)